MVIRLLKGIAGMGGAALLASCASSPSTAVSNASPLPADARCSDGEVALDTSFPAGAFANCTISDSGAVKITLSPEDAPPINCSPWYAFRVNSRLRKTIQIDLNYTACGHRYWPKVSRDGKVWTRLDPKHVELTEFSGRKMARLDLKLDGQPLFVSAQEIIVPATYDGWLDTLESTRQINRSVLGKSAQGRDIEVIRFGKENAREQVVLVGRQHPPEVTGAQVMFPFVETVLSEDPLAKRFRERFGVVAVPLLNPDGVTRGFWRHNTGSTDLNRDWGPFKQPETRLMKGVLDSIASNPDQNLRFFVDFHSTQRDVFYTIPDSLPSDPAHYLKIWLDRYQERMGAGYEVNIQPSKNLEQANSKNYVYRTYGVPAVTFEIGDETERALIGRIGRESAIAMMETLLDTPQP